jgi:hypothetical protein
MREDARVSDACIVVDTNALYTDLRLTGVVWDVLAGAVADDTVCVRFPATAVQEMTAKYSEKIQEAIRDAEKAALLAGDIESASALVSSLRAADTGYRDYLEERLELLGAELLPYPQQSHEEITERALARVPPFNANGGGYRDTCIWLSALDAAVDLDLDIVLVSNDKAFKQDGKDVLAISLIDEAKALGRGATLAKDLKAVVADHLATTDMLAMSEGVKTENLEAFLNENLYESLPLAQLEPELLALPRTARDIELNYAEDVRDVRTSFVRVLPDGRKIFSFEALADAQLELAVDELDAEQQGYTILNRFGLGDARARANKPLNVEGLATFSFGDPVAIEVTEWSALGDDEGHVYWDDPCGCFPSYRRH